MTEETKRKISEGLRRAHKNNPEAWRKDYTMSAKTKEKLSKAKKGMKLTDEWIANRTRSQRGLKRSLETRLKISESKKGANAPFWKGGVSKQNRSDRQNDMSSFSYRNWRKSVFERDDFACQECGMKGGRIQADHIKLYSTHPEHRYDVDNGRTLCVPCHKLTDTWGIKLLLKNKGHVSS